MSFESTTDSFGSINITATFLPAPIRRCLCRGAEPPQARRGTPAGGGATAGHPRGGSLRRDAQHHHPRLHRRKMDEIGLGDFLIRNVINEIRRVPGVGRATLYSTERSLRVWVDPDKLRGLSLSPEDVTDAIRNQNIQIASGAVGAQPSPSNHPSSRRSWLRVSSTPWTILAPSCCAPIPTARTCACATCPGSSSAATPTSSRLG